MTAAMQKEVEKHFTRGEIRRVAASEVGGASYPARVSETYASDLLSTVDVAKIRARGFRIVVDYGFSAASYVLPLVLGPLGVEVVAAHAFPSDGNAEGHGLAASIGQAKRLVSAVSADLGAVFDRAGERLYLIDEQAREVSVEQALLLYLSLIGGGSNGGHGKLAFPVTVTSQVDRLVENTRLRDRAHGRVAPGAHAGGRAGRGHLRRRRRRRLRLPAVPAGLRRGREPREAARAARARRAAALGARRRAAAPDPRPPPDPVPVGAEGARDADPERALAGRDLDLTDGIKVFEERGWAQALPDPDEPVDPPLRRGRELGGLGGARGASCARSSRRSSRAKPLTREHRGSISRGLKSRSRLGAGKG